MGYLSTLKFNMQWTFLLYKSGGYFQRKADKGILRGPYSMRISYVCKKDKRFACHLIRNELFRSHSEVACVHFARGDHEPVELPNEELYSSITVRDLGDISGLAIKLPNIWQKTVQG